MFAGEWVGRLGAAALRTWALPMRQQFNVHKQHRQLARPRHTDYRVPVVLRELGVLRYAPALAEAVDAQRDLPPGGREEVEIRAATVAAVERLRGALASRLAAEGAQAPHLCSVTLDWWLWEEGERNVARHRPHHRTLTTYY